MELVGVENYDQVKQYHKGWVEEYLGDGNNRHDKKWTKSIAVGSKSFVERIKTLLGAVTRGRKVREASEAYQFREPLALYDSHFGIKNYYIEPESSYYWNVYVE